MATLCEACGAQTQRAGFIVMVSDKPISPLCNNCASWCNTNPTQVATKYPWLLDATVPKPKFPQTGSREHSLHERAVFGLVIGAVLGGVVGFLLRPPAPLVGQLPFGAVITRGSNYRGLDVILVPYAETSFNYMLVGLIIGGVAIALMLYLFSNRRS